MQIRQRIFKCGDMQIKHFILDKILNLSSISCCEVLSFFRSFFILGDTLSLRMPALRPASQAGPVRNPREGTSVVLRDTTRLT